MGIKNVSIAQALSGDTNSNPSSAGQLAGIAFQGGTPESSPSPTNTASLPKGVSVPKAAWNPEGHPIANWIIPLLDAAHKLGWKGIVKSGWRSKAEQAAIYNSGVRPAAKPGTSNHEQSDFPGGAVDVTDAATLSKILSKVPGGSALVWAGSKDPVHFSHPHGGGY